MTSFERAAVRDAVKEASGRAKAHREMRSLGETFVKGDPEAEMLQARIEGDAADIFVDVMLAALRRRGAWILFLE